MNNRLVLITGIFGLNAFLVEISKQTSTDNVKENVKFMAHIGFLWIFWSFLDWFGLHLFGLDRIRLVWSSLVWVWLVLIWFGLQWIVLDWIGIQYWYAVNWLWQVGGTHCSSLRRKKSLFFHICSSSTSSKSSSGSSDEGNAVAAFIRKENVISHPTVLATQNLHPPKQKTLLEPMFEGAKNCIF